jgi:hypothetical protein
LELGYPLVVPHGGCFFSLVLLAAGTRGGVVSSLPIASSK